MIKYSVIIPVYNSKEPLGICLDAIKKQVNKQTEIIVVDDCSTQKGIKEIVKNFTLRFFQLKKNCGAGRVRNFGAKRAKGEWLIFIDSDVVVSDNFFKGLFKKLKHLPHNVCLQGVYGWQTPIDNIYSQYKNLYYFYNFFYRIKKERYSYLSSHCFIIRRDVFKAVEGFNRQIKTVIEDADFGFRLFQKGYRVLLDKKLIVTHLKRFSLLGLLKNDAKLSFAKVKHISRNFFRNDREKLIVISGGRVSEMYLILLNVFLAPVFLLVMLVAILYRNTFTLYLLVLLLLFLLISNFNFFKFIVLKKRTVFLLKVIPVYYLDMLSAFWGSVTGVIDYFLLGRKY